jgi:release factor glutamine methyltransferase
MYNGPNQFLAPKRRKVETSLLDLLRDSWIANPDKPDETPESTFRALYFTAAGMPLSTRKALTVTLPELDPEGLKRLEALVKQRRAGIPLAHLTKRQQFMGIEMLAGPEALIPRIETELLGYETLSAVRSLCNSRGLITLLDICTGSGNIVLGIISHESRCTAFASDLSEEAVNLARKNAAFLGLEKRVEFRTGDLFEPFSSGEFLGKFDVISCNPPYISSRKVPSLNPEMSLYEPHVAFDGGSYGFSILTRIIRDAPKFLKPDSPLCMEVGLGQGQFVARMVKNSNQYRDIREVTNNTGEVRVLVATTQS